LVEEETYTPSVPSRTEERDGRRRTEERGERYRQGERERTRRPKEMFKQNNVRSSLTSLKFPAHDVRSINPTRKFFPRILWVED
jgi:hypothetical protein